MGQNKTGAQTIFTPEGSASNFDFQLSYNS